MKLITARIKDLHTLYVCNLRRALDMEQELTRALPRLIGDAADPDLARALENHLAETEDHAVKVGRLLESHAHDHAAETCKSMKGVAVETAEAIADAYDRAIRDIAIIGAAQQMEHHEIAVYGTLRHWAEVLGFSEDAGILGAIEAEEINTDRLLSEISMTVNMQAAH
jgi:ferritin-like metal-binding protein YciE